MNELNFMGINYKLILYQDFFDKNSDFNAVHKLLFSINNVESEFYNCCEEEPFSIYCSIIRILFKTMLT